MGEFDQAFIGTYNALTQRRLQQEQLTEQKRLNNARLKQIEAEDKLTQMNLEALATKMQAEQDLPGMMANLLTPEGPRPTTETIGAQPSIIAPEIDRNKVGNFMMAAEKAGKDPFKFLDFMSVMDKTGGIAAIRSEFEPEQFMKVGEGETVIGLKKSRQRPTGAAPAVQEQPAVTAEPVPALPGQPQVVGTGIPQPEATLMPEGARTVFTGKKKPEKVSVEESKVIGELAQVFPEKMATLQQELGRPPTFNEAGQFFTPAEFAQSFRAREQREREGRIEVAERTGVQAAERQFELAKQKERIPEKPASLERKDFATDLAALRQARNIIDKFDARFVGPIRGRQGNIMEVIGNLGFDEADFRGVVARTRNATIKAITGAQMGEREADRIRQELPEFNLSPDAFIARMRLTYANLYDMARIRRQIGKETGLDLSDLTPLLAPEELDPQIREALRQQAGLTPVGKAQEKTQQGAAKQEEATFLKLLTPENKAQYQRLSPSDKATYKARVLEKIQSLQQVP